MRKIAFKRVIEKITNAPQLKYYDQNETGLGATLTWKDIPVAFGSKKLTPTEGGHAQKEYEMFSHGVWDGQIPPIHTLLPFICPLRMSHVFRRVLCRGEKGQMSLALSAPT